ncbi:MAG: carboxypeptidase-like regulatory domain-containing protein, partial [Bacteroidia bacterium]|nr:carboxypeptidase-like regulatory domain-containing protein [Bacteroidia bacterium]
RNTSRGTQTDARGRYTIEARTGETLTFSHISYKTVRIIIEDITSELNIEMIEKTNELDEVVVIAKSVNGEVVKRRQKADREFQSSRGNVDPRTAGYAVGFVDGEEISNTYSSIKEALRGKLAGYHVNGIDGLAYLRGGNFSVTQDYPVAWEVDGVFSTEEPFGLDLSQIESVYALKSLAATNKYGTLGAGGVIVILTKYGGFNPSEAQRLKIAEQYTNKNYYGNDAIDYNSKVDLNDILILELRDRAYSENNPELLKALAYFYQAQGKRVEAVKVYEDVFKLRPTYAQSYRDLANAYIVNDQFKKGWRLYMSYLMQGHDVSGDDIGQIIYNEMEYLYFNRQNQTAIREQFIPQNETIEEFRNDVRMVFEWNTSEAEFELEFVSPDTRSYVFEHSLEANQELISKEKTIGFSSKEFIIDDVGEGDWLINLTYKGNKMNEPTYFKVTTYYHWGKSGQKKEVTLYKLQDERFKFLLQKLNKSILATFN